MKAIHFVICSALALLGAIYGTMVTNARWIDRCLDEDPVIINYEAYQCLPVKESKNEKT